MLIDFFLIRVFCCCCWFFFPPFFFSLFIQAAEDEYFSLTYNESKSCKKGEMAFAIQSTLLFVFKGRVSWNLNSCVTVFYSYGIFLMLHLSWMIGNSLNNSLNFSSCIVGNTNTNDSKSICQMSNLSVIIVLLILW